MNKIILVPILILSMIFAMGCNKEVEEEINTEATIKGSTNNNVKSNEEMYSIYEKYMPDFKNLVNSYGIELEDISDKQNSYKDKTTLLYYLDESKINEGDIDEVKYVAVINDDGDIDSVEASIDMRVTEDGFKLEESKFNELRKIFTDENIDYTEINEEINKAVKDGVDYNIVNRYEEIEEDILIMSNGITNYTVRIYP